MSTAADTEISVAFKIGIHTFHVLIDSLAPWSTHITKLVDIVRSRYANENLRSLQGAIAMPPRDAEWTIAFAKPKNTSDLSAGWTPLKFADPSSATPAREGLTDDSVLAMVIRDTKDEKAVTGEDFVVDAPEFDYEDEEDDKSDDSEGPQNADFVPDMNDEELEAYLAKMQGKA